MRYAFYNEIDCPNQYIFFPKLKVLCLVWPEIYKEKKYSVAIKIYVEIPGLMSSILDRSMGSTKPMNIYIGVGVTAFPITCHVKKRQCEYSNIN